MGCRTTPFIQVGKGESFEQASDISHPCRSVRCSRGHYCKDCIRCVMFDRLWVGREVLLPFHNAFYTVGHNFRCRELCLRRQSLLRRDPRGWLWAV